MLLTYDMPCQWVQLWLKVAGAEWQNKMRRRTGGFEVKRSEDGLPSSSWNGNASQSIDTRYL